MKVSNKRVGTPNQWKYVQPESGAVFHGLSYWGIVDQVREHRRAMKYDLAEGWEERFQDDLCRQNLEVPCSGRPVDRTKRKLTIADLRRFMATLVNFKGELVSREEAERRAIICSTCPMNREVAGCWGCGGILAEVTKFLTGRTTSRDKSLDSCAVCGCVLRAKIHLPMDVIKSSEIRAKLEYPEGCWQRQASDSAAE
jgi:hypothetical protein